MIGRASSRSAQSSEVETVFPRRHCIFTRSRSWDAAQINKRTQCCAFTSELTKISALDDDDTAVKREWLLLLLTYSRAPRMPEVRQNRNYFNKLEYTLLLGEGEIKKKIWSFAHSSPGGDTFENGGTIATTSFLIFQKTDELGNERSSETCVWHSESMQVKGLDEFRGSCSGEIRLRWLFLFGITLMKGDELSEHTSTLRTSEQWRENSDAK